METVSCLETDEEREHVNLNANIDTILWSEDTSIDDEALSDPVLHLLPFEGYRILDATPTLTQPVKPPCDRNHSYISFRSAGFDDSGHNWYRNTFALAGKYLVKNWSNLLLIFVPIGIIAPELGCGDSAVFVLNCLAIIPLANLLCRATDDAASFLGQTMGALLNVTVGNLAELAIFVYALQTPFTEEQTLTKTVTRYYSATGEIQMRGQAYNILATRAAAGLLCLTTRNILDLSRATSTVLILVYFIYLWTQINSSKFSYKPLIGLNEEFIIPETQENAELDRASVHRHMLTYPWTCPPFPQLDRQTQIASLDLRDLPDPSLPESFAAKLATALNLIKSLPWVRKAIPGFLIMVSTGLISISGELLVTSIDHFVDHSPISKTMVGLIILPLVGNAAELISGIMFGYRKQLDLAFAVCIGSAIQIALFVAPLVVLLGWVLFVSLIFDNKCSSLKGASLLAGYVIISLASCFIPSVGD
ncbi:hypothetical protein N0V90_003026 [Kalmusia sp. IMI 367209]|nr:hypothetical protein N0V90_003026 [Kalmusia sp. IMI 367209]